MKKAIINTVLTIILLALLITLSIILNTTLKSPQIIIENIIQNNQTEKKIQWDHMPLTYSIVNEKTCGQYETTIIKRAFKEISEETQNNIQFKLIPTGMNEDITIKCKLIENCYEFIVYKNESGIHNTEKICAHNNGETIIKKNNFSTITHAQIELIGISGFSETEGKGFSGYFIGNCNPALTVKHEILHALGFEHSTKRTSIMFPISENLGLLSEQNTCKEFPTKLNESILKLLKH